jgi:hypothetical protein
MIERFTSPNAPLLGLLIRKQPSGWWRAEGHWQGLGTHACEAATSPQDALDGLAIWFEHKTGGQIRQAFSDILKAAGQPAGIVDGVAERDESA